MQHEHQHEAEELSFMRLFFVDFVMFKLIDLYGFALGFPPQSARLTLKYGG